MRRNCGRCRPLRLLVIHVANISSTLRQAPRDAFPSGRKSSPATSSTAMIPRASENASRSSRTTTSVYTTRRRYAAIPTSRRQAPCIGHRKLQRRLTYLRIQKARAAAIQAAWRKSLAERPREDGPTAGEVRSLGLIPGPPEEKNLKPAKFIPRIQGDGTAF
jgi:hypothetical protein